MSYWADPKPVRRIGTFAGGKMARDAVALLDEGGITALTIRALAGRLRVAPPRLHSRIESVDDLLDLALDRALERDAQVWTANDEGPTRSCSPITTISEATH